jgi:DNA-binding LacI/PurR family transcriptional regulator
MTRVPQRPSAAEAIIQMAHQLPQGQTRPPGLRELSRQLGFSVAQVRTAIRYLVGLGALKSVHGSGTFYLGGQIEKSRLQTLESASLIIPRRRSAPMFHVLCVPQLVTSPVHAQMLVAIVNAFARRNEVVHIDTVPIEEWDDWVQKRRRLRGLLIAEFATRRIAKVLDRRRIPWVVLNRLPEGVSAHCVVLDDRKLAATLVDHLHALGHRRIGFAYPQLDDPVPALRKEGFLRRCKELSIRATLHPQADGEAPSINRFLESGCTAIACNNDDLALQVMREARRIGVNVPGQLSVCGIDNTPDGLRSQPSLTTVLYPRPMMGEWAVKMLLSLERRNTRRKQRWVVPSEVVARQSTAAPFVHAAARLTPDPLRRRS